MAQITFKDLSTPLKTVVVFSWIWIGLFAIGFLIGFVEGILGVL